MPTRSAPRLTYLLISHHPMTSPVAPFPLPKWGRRGGGGLGQRSYLDTAMTPQKLSHYGGCAPLLLSSSPLELLFELLADSYMQRQGPSQAAAQPTHLEWDLPWLAKDSLLPDEEVHGRAFRHFATGGARDLAELVTDDTRGSLLFFCFLWMTQVKPSVSTASAAVSSSAAAGEVAIDATAACSCASGRWALHCLLLCQLRSSPPRLLCWPLPLLRLLPQLPG